MCSVLWECGYLCGDSCMYACGVFVCYINMWGGVFCVCMCVYVYIYSAPFWMSGHPGFLSLFRLLAQFPEKLWADVFDMTVLESYWSLQWVPSAFHLIGCCADTPFYMPSQGLNTLCHEDRARTRLSGLTRSSFTHAAALCGRPLAPDEDQTRLLQKGSQRRQCLTHLASLSSTAAVWRGGLKVTVARSPGPSPPSHSRFLPRLQFKIQHPDTCSPHPTTLIKSYPTVWKTMCIAESVYLILGS